MDSWPRAPSRTRWRSCNVGEPVEVLERTTNVTLGQAHGFFDEPFELTMSTASLKAEIWYTTNSRDP